MSRRPTDQGIYLNCGCDINAIRRGITSICGLASAPLAARRGWPGKLPTCFVVSRVPGRKGKGDLGAAKARIVTRTSTWGRSIRSGRRITARHAHGDVVYPVMRIPGRTCEAATKARKMVKPGQNWSDSWRGWGCAGVRAVVSRKHRLRESTRGSRRLAAGSTPHPVGRGGYDASRCVSCRGEALCVFYLAGLPARAPGAHIQNHSNRRLPSKAGRLREGNLSACSLVPDKGPAKNFSAG